MTTITCKHRVGKYCLNGHHGKPTCYLKCDVARRRKRAIAMEKARNTILHYLSTTIFGQRVILKTVVENGKVVEIEIKTIRSN